MPDWSTELVEIVAAIRETLTLIPDGVALLDEIVAGPLITADELPAVPDALRKPPKTRTTVVGQDGLAFDEDASPRMDTQEEG